MKVQSTIWQRGAPVLLVLALGALLIAAVVLLKPRPEPRPELAPPPPQVNIVLAQPQTHTLPVHTQGTVAPRRQIELVSQVGGRIVEVAPEFASGGFFAAGDWLVQVDTRDYEFALTRAEARLRDAQMALANERGLARQAQREWRDLGNREANELFLREPQLAAAEANVRAARAERDQAQLELERTRITVPFAGRVRDKTVDLGQYITPGTPVARIFDAAAVEIRLPLTDQQAALVDLPLLGGPRDALPRVILHGTLAGEPHQWQGRITRTEATLDAQSRQFYALAEVEDPFNADKHGAPLMVGAFVEAEIQGRALDKVVQLPRSAVFRRDLIYTLDQDQRVQQKTVRVLHRDDEHIWVRGDLAPGEAVVRDRQGYIGPGVSVAVAGDTGSP